MSIDSVSAIGARLTQIRALVEGVSAGGAAASGTSSGGDFDAALADVLAGGGSSGWSSGLSAGSSSALGNLFAGSSAAGGVVGLSGLGSLFTTSPPVAGGATPSAVLNADGVPADLAAYGNGRIPESVLAPIDGSSERMWAPAAGALNRLIAAAAADGVTIGVTDGYRSYEAQTELVRTKGLYSEGGLAAAPGTSEHGWGMAADLALDASGLAWMRANGERFGFAETTPRESWHWSYHPS